MENHIVNIEFTINEGDTTGELKKLVLPKFKPPATIKKVEPTLMGLPVDNVQNTSKKFIVKGAYSVAREELDDIWGSAEEESEEENVAASHDNRNRTVTATERSIISDRRLQQPFPSSSSSSSLMGTIRSEQVQYIYIQRNICVHNTHSFLYA